MSALGAKIRLIWGRGGHRAPSLIYVVEEAPLNKRRKEFELSSWWPLLLGMMSRLSTIYPLQSCRDCPHQPHTLATTPAVATPHLGQAAPQLVYKQPLVVELQVRECYCDTQALWGMARGQQDWPKNGFSESAKGVQES